jgi:hypothetical protein
LLLEFTGYFQKAASLYIEWHLSLPKSDVSTGMSGRDGAEITFLHRPVSQTFTAADILHKYSKVEALNIVSLNFQPF